MRRRTNGYAIHACVLILAGFLLLLSELLLSGCGSGSPAGGQSGFGMTSSSQTGVTGDAVVSSVVLNPATVTGGVTIAVTVTLATPAPAGGLNVRLVSSDPATLPMPASVQIAAGQSSAAVQVAIAAMAVASSVTITASAANSKAGANLSILSSTTVPFTVVLKPTTVTVLQGKSGTSKITTAVSSGYDHSLQLKISGDPVGVTASAKPTVIPAPGLGTSQLTTSVQTVTETGSYPLMVTATDGTNSASAKLTLNVISGTTNPNATFKGCLYKSGGHSYQGVDLKVGNPGTYPFNAVLYSGTTCNVNDYADQFGFGDPLTLGSSNYIFWFTDFKDMTNMSAIWYLGDENSKCVSYATAPAC
jgi:hypothetical protein